MYNDTVVHDELNLQLPLSGFFSADIGYDLQQVVPSGCSPFKLQLHHPSLSMDGDYDMENAMLWSADDLELHGTSSDENLSKRAKPSDSFISVDINGIGDSTISNGGTALSEVPSSPFPGIVHECHHLPAILSAVSFAQSLDDLHSRQEPLPSENCENPPSGTRILVPVLESGFGQHGSSDFSFSTQKKVDDGTESGADNDASFILDNTPVSQSPECEATEPLEESADIPPTAFADLRADAEIFLDNLKHDLLIQPQVPQQVPPSDAVTEPRGVFERETTEPLAEGEDKPPAAFFHVEAAENGLLFEPPAVEQQASETVAEPRSAFEREATEPLEEGKDRSPTAFLSYEQRVSSDSIENFFGRTSSRVPQQSQPSAYGDEILQHFEGEPTEPLEERQGRALAVLHTYGQHIAPLHPSHIGDGSRIRIPQQVMPSSSSNDIPWKSFVRESTEPLEEGQDTPPVAFMNAQSNVDRSMAQSTSAPIIEHDHTTIKLTNTTSPPPFPSFHDQSRPATVFRSAGTSRRVVLNKLGRPVRQLTREQLKRALGGTPCQPYPMATPTIPSTENRGNEDEEEDRREERADPAKRRRRHLEKKLPCSSLAPSEKCVRFGIGRRAHFDNAVARFAARSQCSAIRPILRCTVKEPTQPIVASSSGGAASATQISTLGSDDVLNPIPRLRSPPPVLNRRRSRRRAIDMGVKVDSEADRVSPSFPLLVDELDRKNARRGRKQWVAQHAAKAAGGAVRHARQNHREEWINIRRWRGPTDGNAAPSCLVGVQICIPSLICLTR